MEWSKLVTLTGESIDWLEANERIYDVWLLVAYAATSCALVQVRVSHLGVVSAHIFSSITRGHGGRTKKLQPSCVNSEIVFDGGKARYRLTTCQ